IPSKTECQNLLHAAGCTPQIIAHSITVCELSMLIADSINKKNPNLVSIPHTQAGALLHDIGRSTSHSIDHACVGAAICREHQIDEKICTIVLHHIGAGIIASEAKELGLPPIDYMPTSLEEKIVAHADNLVMEMRIIPIQKRIQVAKKKGISQIAIRRMIDLHHEINELCMIPIEELQIKKILSKKQIKKALQDETLDSTEE
ncbi:MAG: HD domain-containing protein, partial [Methanomicrobiales archaeon]|nr:HD domain-containing protein [Methanomicrobiales archaeon]